jgi:hypothetical protein
MAAISISVESINFWGFCLAIEGESIYVSRHTNKISSGDIYSTCPSYHDESMITTITSECNSGNTRLIISTIIGNFYVLTQPELNAEIYIFTSQISLWFEKGNRLKKRCDEF